MALEDKDKHILIYPFWLGEPEHPNRRDVLCLYSARPELAWGSGTHDQWIGPETLFSEMFKNNQRPNNEPQNYISRWLQSFFDRKQFKAWIEENADKYASVTINLGWHLWPHLSYKSGDELYNLIDMVLSVTNGDKLYWRFTNGWDLHNVDEEKRQDWFLEQTRNLDQSKIVMHLCNHEMTKDYKKLLPDADIKWDNIYFTRMTNKNIKHNFVANTETRNKKIVCLNNYNKWHRSEVVQYLRDNQMLSDTHTSYINGPPHLQTQNISLGTNFDAVDTETSDNIGEWQDSPPFEIMNDAYTYVATETFYTDENLTYAYGDVDLGLGQATFITEKTLKGFYYELPMLVVGTPRTLVSLRELGFKTFPEFFNETYDEQICPNIRMGLIKNNIKDIMSKDLNYLHKLYWSDNVQAKLKHNRELFFDYVRNSSTNKYDSRLQEGFYKGYNSNFDKIYYDK